MSNKHISALSYNDIEKMMNKTVRIKEKEDEVQVCPNCMSETFTSTFGLSSFFLKGGGWYKDGYAKKN